eukprot:Clim_evm30s99 gene=Clim_evmTU30s99
MALKDRSIQNIAQVLHENSASVKEEPIEEQKPDISSSVESDRLDHIEKLANDLKKESKRQYWAGLASSGTSMERERDFLRALRGPNPPKARQITSFAGLRTLLVHLLHRRRVLRQQMIEMEAMCRAKKAWLETAHKMDIGSSQSDSHEALMEARLRYQRAVVNYREGPFKQAMLSGLPQTTDDAHINAEIEHGLEIQRKQQALTEARIAEVAAAWAQFRRTHSERRRAIQDLRRRVRRARKLTRRVERHAVALEALRNGEVTLLSAPHGTGAEAAPEALGSSVTTKETTDQLSGVGEAEKGNVEGYYNQDDDMDDSYDFNEEEEEESVGDEIPEQDADNSSDEEEDDDCDNTGAITSDPFTEGDRTSLIPHDKHISDSDRVRVAVAQDWFRHRVSSLRERHTDLHKRIRILRDVGQVLLSALDMDWSQEPTLAAAVEVLFRDEDDIMEN